MCKKILIVHAHPEPTSVTQELVRFSVEALQAQGHEVLQSDLYGMRWKAVYDADDFPVRVDTSRLSFITESGHAYSNGLQTPDVTLEHQKLRAADAVIFHFPLWWFGMPAILKGWFDRVFAHGLAYGYKGRGNRYRYGDGAFKGKRALLCVSVGGPEQDYAPRGINGPLEQLLFPITHGSLFFAGFDVLPTFAVYGAAHIGADSLAVATAAWRARLGGIFEDAPIPFRSQNGGDYPDGHVLASHVAPGQSGLFAHLADGTPCAGRVAWTAECNPSSAAAPHQR